jgi:hypothetical protein
VSGRTELVAALEALGDQLPPAPRDLVERVMADVAELGVAPVCDLDHLHLETVDLEPTRCYYERWFHFEGDTLVDGTLFVHNRHGFLLCLTPVAEVEPLPDGVHFGFTMPSAAAVDRLWGAMQAAGAAASDVHRSDGFASFHCTDPDGRVIEVFWEAPAHVAPAAGGDGDG